MADLVSGRVMFVEERRASDEVRGLVETRKKVWRSGQIIGVALRFAELESSRGFFFASRRL